MTVKALKTIVAYLVVGLFSTGLAFFVVTQFIAQSFSQEPPLTQPPSTAEEPPQQLPQPPPQQSEGEAATPMEGEADDVTVSKFTNVQPLLEPFIYDPKNRKDPFSPNFETGMEEGSKLQSPLLPLQRFNLNEIQLVGIIWGVEKPQAMFMDPTKRVHIIGKNERIGRNNGYIAVIREGEVVIVEPIRRDDEVVYNSTVMRIVR